jgi:hypothetical protein
MKGRVYRPNHRQVALALAGRRKGRYALPAHVDSKGAVGLPGALAWSKRRRTR